MQNTPRYASFSDYLRVVRDRRLIVVLTTLLFAGATLGWSLQQDKVYEAEATLNFKDINRDSSVLGTVTFDTTSADQRAAVAAENFGRIELARQVKRRLRIDATPEALSAAVDAVPESRTALVILRARWDKATKAAAIADAFADAALDTEQADARRRFKEAAVSQRAITKSLPNTPENAFTRAVSAQQVARLEQLAKLVEPVEITRHAAIPAKPIAPRPIRNTILGLLFGLTIGLVVAFARDSLDSRFRSAKEISDELKMPLLGYVGEEAMGRTAVKSNGAKPLDAADLEAFRILRTNVEFLNIDKAPQVVLVTSALPEEGKSTVSASLACTYASAGKRTLLLECDLRRPTLGDRLALQKGPGLTDYLAGKAGPQEVLQRLDLVIGEPGSATDDQPAMPGPIPLAVITSGSPSPLPAELLRSDRFKAFLREVQEVYEIIVIDTSPLLAVVDALELLAEADAVIVCVRASKTTRDQARAARVALDHFPERARGVVVTGLKRGALDNYGYYSYGYGYGY